MCRSLPMWLSCSTDASTAIILCQIRQNICAIKAIASRPAAMPTRRLWPAGASALRRRLCRSCRRPCQTSLSNTVLLLHGPLYVVVPVSARLDDLATLVSQHTTHPGHRQHAYTSQLVILHLSFSSARIRGWRGQRSFPARAQCSRRGTSARRSRG